MSLEEMLDILRKKHAVIIEGNASMWSVHVIDSKSTIEKTVDPDLWTAVRMMLHRIG